MMRKALTDAQQHLVDAYEAARKRDDDDAQTTRALHAVLDAIALLHIPAFDIPAALKRAKLTPPKPQLPQRGQNAAQRTSGAGQVRAATTAPTSASALLQPTAQGNLNSQIDDLTAKLAALKKRKDHERREMEKKEREKRAAAAKRAPVQKHQREQRRR